MSAGRFLEIIRLHSLCHLWFVFIIIHFFICSVFILWFLADRVHHLFYCPKNNECRSVPRNYELSILWVTTTFIAHICSWLGLFQSRPALAKSGHFIDKASELAKEKLQNFLMSTYKEQISDWKILFVPTLFTFVRNQC